MSEYQLINVYYCIYLSILICDAGLAKCIIKFLLIAVN